MAPECVFSTTAPEAIMSLVENDRIGVGVWEFEDGGWPLPCPAQVADQVAEFLRGHRPGEVGGHDRGILRATVLDVFGFHHDPVALAVGVGLLARSAFVEQGACEDGAV